MGEVVNLRRVRKARERATCEAKAAQNRVLFGRTRAARDQQALQDALLQRRHADHRLTLPGSDDA